MASGMACTHCSRAPYAGHHVDCPDHPDTLAKAAEAAMEKKIADAATAHADAVDLDTVANDRILNRMDVVTAFCCGAMLVYEATKKVTP